MDCLMIFYGISNEDESWLTEIIGLQTLETIVFSPWMNELMNEYDDDDAAADDDDDVSFKQFWD